MKAHTIKSHAASVAGILSVLVVVMIAEAHAQWPNIPGQKQPPPWFTVMKGKVANRAPLSTDDLPLKEGKSRYTLEDMVKLRDGSMVQVKDALQGANRLETLMRSSGHSLRDTGRIVFQRIAPNTVMQVKKQKLLSQKYLPETQEQKETIQDMLANRPVIQPMPDRTPPPPLPESDVSAPSVKTNDGVNLPWHMDLGLSGSNHDYFRLIVDNKVEMDASLRQLRFFCESAIHSRIMDESLDLFRMSFDASAYPLEGRIVFTPSTYVCGHAVHLIDPIEQTMGIKIPQGSSTPTFELVQQAHAVIPIITGINLNLTVGARGELGFPWYMIITPLRALGKVTPNVNAEVWASAGVSGGVKGCAVGFDLIGDMVLGKYQGNLEGSIGLNYEEVAEKSPVRLQPGSDIMQRKIGRSAAMKTQWFIEQKASYCHWYRFLYGYMGVDVWIDCIIEKHWWIPIWEFDGFGDGNPRCPWTYEKRTNL